ncbi:MAG TPA: hypothetical protein VFF64_29965, partial [Candidatus Eremiobacteraceae bacterium]|nr:hypothetical protein [Candidatus Eremiobacteraceae bacterium]
GRSSLWFFPTFVQIELVQQIQLRAYAVSTKVGWGKELVLAFGARSHGRNLLPVPQDDDEAALCHGSICCHQSAIAMRLCARQPSTKLTLLPRNSTTSRTTHREYLFWAEDPFHAGQIMPKNHVQEWSILTTTADFRHYRMTVTVTIS